ncbi:MAG: TIGR02921 family PEP-CTERM protein [Spirulina sp. DLM2.Bin59]|nr:MAG: TIGR02921 family PEP-CTERM protein [Spirulina sp. DLM2.Bin59]
MAFALMPSKHFWPPWSMGLMPSGKQRCNGFSLLLYSSDNAMHKPLKNSLNLFYYSIFTLWNIAFLTVIYGFWLPWDGGRLIGAIASGELQQEMAISLLGFMVIPPICTGIGIWKFRTQPLELMRLFFGIEAPLFVLCTIRFFALRQLTPASSWLVGSVAIVIVAFAAERVTGYWGKTASRRATLLATVQTALHTLMIVMGIYAGLLLFLYVLPLAGFTVQFLWDWVVSGNIWQDLGRNLTWFWEDLQSGYFWEAIAVVFWTVLFMISVPVFFALPMSFALLYGDSGRRILRQFSQGYGRRRAMVVVLGTLALWFAVSGGLGQQPQGQAFALLDRDIANPGIRQVLLNQAPRIRKGLLNAYLSEYRYLGINSESSLLRIWYEEAFHLPRGVATVFQETHDLLLSPFLYSGERGDVERAAAAYASFFDTPIQKGEREAILKALTSTSNLDAANAGVLDIGRQKVLLKHQELTIEEQGDWADVELYEVYENQTFEVEEIFYSFSLPETAVLTGVWLGETADRGDRFPFQISPRGAAQAVYNSQVQRERPVDPALLEQVGPHQYRLRAFPILPRPSNWEQNAGQPAPPMHLWLTYRTLATDQGWPLPQVSEARNVFWTKDTERFHNGAAAASSDAWLAAYAPRGNSAPPQSHRAILNSYAVTAEPLKGEVVGDYRGKRLAIALDTSYSMAQQRAGLKAVLEELQAEGLGADQIDLYLSAAPGIEPRRVDGETLAQLGRSAFFGSLQLKTMVRQFDQLRRGQDYDALILLSDQGSYELADDSGDVPGLGMPIWAVHLGGYPIAYDDQILAAIQGSGGGSTDAISAALTRLATDAPGVQHLDGYRWQMASVADDPAQPLRPDQFAPLAARFLIHQLSRETDPTDPTQLDQLHNIATTTEIVTPYSSMIVLVNDEQRAMLRAAEAAEDRFERRVEDGSEILQAPPSVTGVTAVPEPGTWLAALLVTAWFVNQRRRLVR